MKPISFLLLLSALVPLHPAFAAQPNVLFIAVDDLNDWFGCPGGHPQTKTPNFDRLAASGVLFANAYCAGAACNPSRTSIMMGLPTHRPGLYNNRQRMREVLTEAKLIPHNFSQHAYWAAGSGKILHYVIDPASWDDYYPDKAKPEHQSRAAEPRPIAPANPAPVAAVSLASLTSLDWHSARAGPTPPSKPDGDRLDVTFVNAREQSWSCFGRAVKVWRKPTAASSPRRRSARRRAPAPCGKSIRRTARVSATSSSATARRKQ